MVRAELRFPPESVISLCSSRNHARAHINSIQTLTVETPGCYLFIRVDHVQNSKGKSSFVERRAWERISIHIPVYIRTQMEENQTVSELTTALNISAGGAFIATKRYLRPGQSLTAEIPPAPFPSLLAYPESGRKFSAVAVRVTSIESYYGVGIRFSSPLASTPKAATTGTHN
jgi:hypothetical protein